MPGPGIDPGPFSWEAVMLTTRPLHLSMCVLDDMEKRREDKEVVVELKDYLDEYYLRALKEKLNMTVTKSIVTLIQNKWIDVST